MGAETCAGAPLTGECKVGVKLISTNHERLAPVCLAATSLSVCFISACQALFERLLVAQLLGLGHRTAGKMGPTEHELEILKYC